MISITLIWNNIFDIRSILPWYITNNSGRLSSLKESAS